MIFIAEVSSNHAQDLDRCYSFIDTSARSGFDAVKFQLFRMNELFTQDVLKQKPECRDRKNWELPPAFLPKLAKRCEEQNIAFACTPFYLDAVEELYPYVAFYKIASYELLWDELLAMCAKTGKPVILSTGMATLDEVKHAVEVLRQNGCSQISLMHCTSAYPAPPEDVNLSAIETLRHATGCDVGWSDHTVEPAVLARAVHRWGASTIEVHLDLDGNGAEFSAGHCWLPEQIKSLIEMIRLGLKVDGTGVKQPAPSESTERLWRADPVDGLRPLLAMRERLVCECA